jgi:hypothetical protein
MRSGPRMRPRWKLTITNLRSPPKNGRPISRMCVPSGSQSDAAERILTVDPSAIVPFRQYEVA